MPTQAMGMTGVIDGRQSAARDRISARAARVSDGHPLRAAAARRGCRRALGHAVAGRPDLRFLVLPYREDELALRRVDLDSACELLGRPQGACGVPPGRDAAARGDDGRRRRAALREPARARGGRHRAADGRPARAGRARATRCAIPWPPRPEPTARRATPRQHRSGSEPPSTSDGRCAGRPARPNLARRSGSSRAGRAWRAACGRSGCAIGVAMLACGLGADRASAQQMSLDPERGVITMAPLLERTTPAVVNISVQSREAAAENPLFRDPFFRRFFDLPEQPQARRAISAGSGRDRRRAPRLCPDQPPCGPFRRAHHGHPEGPPRVPGRAGRQRSRHRRRAAAGSRRSRSPPCRSATATGSRSAIW